MELPVNRGHASARQLSQVPIDSEGGNSHLANYVDEALECRGTRRALDEAPHVPIVAASPASAFNEKVHAGLLFPGDIIALRAMERFPKYSLLLPEQSEIPQEVWGAFCSVWLCGFGPPKRIQPGGIRIDLCAERRIKLRLQEVGARPWLFGRRNGPARGIFSRLVELRTPRLKMTGSRADGPLRTRSRV